MIEELPLLAFTLCTQIAAGLFIARAVCGISLKGTTGEWSLRRMPASSLCVAILMVVGMTCSLFHLKHVDHVMLVFGNIGTSWLSREIALSAVFFLMSVVVLIFERQKKLDGAVIACRWIGVAAALIMLFAQAMAYSHTGIAAWGAPYTLTTFLLCAAATGSAALAFFLARPGNAQQNARAIRWLAIVAVAAVVLSAVAFAAHLAELAALPMGAGAAILIESHPVLIACRFVFSVVGAALLCLAAYKSGNKTLPIGLATTALIGIVIGEVLGRIVFYSGFIAF